MLALLAYNPRMSTKAESFSGARAAKARAAPARPADRAFEPLRKLLDARFKQLSKQMLGDPAKLARWERSVLSVLKGQDARLSELVAAQARLQGQLARVGQSLEVHQELLANVLALQERSPVVLSHALPAVLPSPANQGLQAMRSRLADEGFVGTDDGWQALVKQGEGARVVWTEDGLLVPTATLSKKWKRTRQALDQATQRDELFNLKVRNRLWYPSAFLDLAAEDVGQVCLALKGADPSSKFVFWMRRHGALGGKTISEAIREGKLARAVALARAYAQEHGWVEHVAAA